MYLKSLVSFDLKSLPLQTPHLSKKMKSWNRNIWKLVATHNLYPYSLSDLSILCLHEAYSHRVGVFGYGFNFFSYLLSQNCESFIIKNCLDFLCLPSIQSNDAETIAHYLSLPFRVLPFFNLVHWDSKSFIDSNHYKYIYRFDKSKPSSTDLKSLFLLNPLYDSGCAICSSVPADIYDFEKWSVSSYHYSDYSINKGICWALFKNILIITFNLIIDENLYHDQLKQVLSLKNNLMTKYIFNETFIVFNDTEPDNDFFIKNNFTLCCDPKNSMKKIYYCNSSSYNKYNWIHTLDSEHTSIIKNIFNTIPFINIDNHSVDETKFDNVEIYQETKNIEQTEKIQVNPIDNYFTHPPPISPESEWNIV
jgi:hypothetical protein